MKYEVGMTDGSSMSVTADRMEPENVAGDDVAAVDYVFYGKVGTIGGGIVKKASDEDDDDDGDDEDTEVCRVPRGNVRHIRRVA